MPDTQDTPLWGKCAVCGHCWPVAYYPIDLGKLPPLLKTARCPKGCAGKPVLAAQDGGRLLEPQGEDRGNH